MSILTAYVLATALPVQPFAKNVGTMASTTCFTSYMQYVKALTVIAEDISISNLILQFLVRILHILGV